MSHKQHKGNQILQISREFGLEHFRVRKYLSIGVQIPYLVLNASELNGIHVS